MTEFNKSRSFHIDDFIRWKYINQGNKWFVEGLVWDHLSCCPMCVILPLMVIDAFGVGMGIYEVEGQDYWCEPSIMD